MAQEKEPQDDNQVPLRLLVADDVEEARRGVRLMLELLPNVQVVGTAHDGVEAVEMARKHQPDVVIMDINMPQLDGLEATRAMREFLPGLVCIILSAEREGPTVRKAVEVGVQAYLIKPFSAQELQTVMDKARRLVHHRRQAAEVRRKRARQRELERLAEAYARTRRADDEAVRVFEALAADPQCPQRWLMTLAIVYVIRRDWRKLKFLAAYLERRSRSETSP